MGQILRDVKDISRLLREQCKKKKDDGKTVEQHQKPYEVQEDAVQQKYVH